MSILTWAFRYIIRVHARQGSCVTIDTGLYHSNASNFLVLAAFSQVVSSDKTNLADLAELGSSFKLNLIEMMLKKSCTLGTAGFGNKKECLRLSGLLIVYSKIWCLRQELYMPHLKCTEARYKVRNEVMLDTLGKSLRDPESILLKNGTRKNTLHSIGF